MKRWAGILLAAALSIACCACSMQKPELSVAPSSFSRETTEVLRPFQSELQFVDLKLNEDAKQWKISLWSYRDGEWKEQGKSGSVRGRWLMKSNQAPNHFASQYD